MFFTNETLTVEIMQANPGRVATIHYAKGGTKTGEIRNDGGRWSVWAGVGQNQGLYAIGADDKVTFANPDTDEPSFSIPASFGRYINVYKSSL